MTSTLLSDGLVVDGTGAPAFRGHVLIDGARIAAVLPSDGSPLPGADRAVSVAGKAVAPGFVDVHSHLDWVLATRSGADLVAPFLEQGVTTVVAGNCGISPWPHRPAAIPLLERLAAVAIDEPLDYRWRSMGDLLDRFEELRPPLNVAQLVGHAAIRYAAASTVRGPLAEPERGACLREAERCLEAGCAGLSFGLGYDPGMFSPLGELRAFASVVASAGKTLAVHLKALSRLSPTYSPAELRPHNVRALEEMLDLARRTGVRLQLSHFLFVGKRSWPLAETCLAMVDDARRRGLDVMIDAFPFTCGNTTVDAPLPAWFLRSLPEGYGRLGARLCLALELHLGLGLVGSGFEDLVLMHPGAARGWDELCGLTFREIGARRGRSAFTVLLELSEASRGSAVVLFHGYSGVPGEEAALEAVLGHEACLFETDAVVRSAGLSNPAARGAFPRVLGRHVRERRAFGLEEAVRRMTGASAERFGLEGRGRLAPGAAADLVVFDPETIADDEGGGRPRGLDLVFVNGAQAVSRGRADPAVRAGQVLRI